MSNTKKEKQNKNKNSKKPFSIYNIHEGVSIGTIKCPFCEAGLKAEQKQELEVDNDSKS